MEINKQFCGNENLSIADGKIVRKPILPDEINGVNIFYFSVTPDNTYHHINKKKTLNVFLFFNGSGTIKEGSKTFNVNEISLFVPYGSQDVYLSAVNDVLEVLEIELELLPEDIAGLQKNISNFPFFISYSQCRQYKEAIKSAKTINRMLLPENIIPRFCMGSVKTSGPDKIDEHEHPMLEQLFFGLANNHCIVKADNKEAEFLEKILLHIPLGSKHSVEVQEGKTLHYIWMDYFKSQKDMEYISKSHIMDE